MSTEIRAIEEPSIPDSWLRQYLYNPYRNYRLFSTAERLFLLRAKLRGSEILAAFSDGRLSAIVGGQSLPWDSQMLDRSSGRLGPLLAVEECPLAVLTELVKASVSQREAANEHYLHLEIDSADWKALAASQAAGFRVLDTRLTYGGTRQVDFERPGEARFRIRAYQESDREVVLDIAKEMFPTLTGRFRSDPTLSSEQAETVYMSWLENCLKSESEDKVVVACRSEEAVGFLSYKLDAQVLELTGKRVFGRGLSAVRADAFGAYVDLLCEAILAEWDNADAVEMEASLTNPRSFHLFERIKARLLLSRYVLSRAPSP